MKELKEEIMALKEKWRMGKGTPEKDGVKKWDTQVKRAARKVGIRLGIRRTGFRMEVMSGGDLKERNITVWPETRRPDWMALLYFDVANPHNPIGKPFAVLCFEAKRDLGCNHEIAVNQARKQKEMLENPACTFAKDKLMDPMRHAQEGAGGLRVYQGVLMVGRDGGDVNQRRKNSLFRKYEGHEVGGPDPIVMFLGHDIEASVERLLMKAFEDHVNDFM